MDKQLWLKSEFDKKNIPDWTCPHCAKSILKIRSFESDETALSKEWQSHEDWEPEFIRFSFSGSLICPTCEEFVSFLGNGWLELYNRYDYQTERYMEEGKACYAPKYFYPALVLFEIPDKCPEKIREIISESFALYWSDLASCANKIRVSLEILMDEFRVKKTYINRNRNRKRLSLHQRIEEFKKLKKDVAEFLLAIKWIGNTGSHIGELNKMDILETYEMLELALNKLYDNNEVRLTKIAKEINKNKGRRKRK